MSLLVAMSGNLMCSMGNAPAPIKVSSQNKVLAEGKPAATIQDAAPTTNVGPFGMCMSLANPAVASATAAAMGTLTPQPCMPVPVGTWLPANPKVLIAGKPCLTQDCKLMCAYAGQITVTVPGQQKTNAN